MSEEDAIKLAEWIVSLKRLRLGPHKPRPSREERSDPHNMEYDGPRPACGPGAYMEEDK